MKDNLPEGWRKIRLGEIAEFNLNNYTSKDNWRYVNYLDTGNLTSNLIGDIFFLDLETNKLPSRAKRKVKKNDILYSTVRPNQKHIGIITEPLKNMLVSTGFAVMTVNLNEANPYYIYSYLDQVKVTNHLQAIAEQRVSTYPALNIADLQTLPISLPPLPEQEAIASTLSVLDDKIELNNRINENLEAQAQALFKHWFVDFEFPDENGKPYKSSGGAMVESELGMIPEGWEISKLDELIERIDNRGKTPPYEKGKTEFPILDVATLRGNSRIINYDTVSKYISEETYSNSFRNGHPVSNDILMSTVGSLAELKMFMGNIGSIAQNVVALRSKNISPFYLYEYLKFIKDDLISYDIGSVQPSIKITHIIKHSILIPKNLTLKLFSDLLKSITDVIYKNHKQNQVLSSLRDVLLPVLMSGKLRLSGTDGGV